MHVRPFDPDRGIVRHMKTAAVHRAAASGITTAYTGNDNGNAPMLAINERLGHRVDSRETTSRSPQWPERRRVGAGMRADGRVTTPGPFDPRPIPWAE